jgi:hypothetical protein
MLNLHLPRCLGIQEAGTGKKDQDESLSIKFPSNPLAAYSSGGKKDLILSTNF